ncbi:MAG TPA: TIGR02530 family flagellar biosynthesis protein [Bacillales bacterium]|jgi:flagellar operon protein|nr:TIGR02530 family flagellar biosynthesis protein [Bacillales bacterium]
MTHRIQPHMMPKTYPRHAPQGRKTGNVSFGQLLDRHVEGSKPLKVSKHAARRMEERNLSIEESQWKIIDGKVKEAKQKGITDSLVVTGNAALIVNAKNHTVVTAMNRKEAASHIFTNINGTILLD